MRRTRHTRRLLESRVKKRLFPSGLGDVQAVRNGSEWLTSIARGPRPFYHDSLLAIEIASSAPTLPQDIDDVK